MGKYLFVLFGAAVLMATLAATPAKADSIDTFVFTTCEAGPNSCGAGASLTQSTYIWQAPASPTPTSFINTCCSNTQFTITADVKLNGTELGAETIVFGNQGLGGIGFEIENPSCSTCFIAAGATSKLWSGAPSSPTFTLGTYTVAASDLPSPHVGTLTISSAVGTPEPSTELQTGIGLLLGLGAMLLWRKQSPSLIES